MISLRYARSLIPSARLRRSVRNLQRAIPQVGRASLGRPRPWSKPSGITGELNFGDLLTPLLLQHGGIATVLVPEGEAELLGVGSVSTAPLGYRGHIWGTGVIGEEYVPRDVEGASFWAVRGHLTKGDHGD